MGPRWCPASGLRPLPKLGRDVVTRFSFGAREHGLAKPAFCTFDIQAIAASTTTLARTGVGELWGSIDELLPLGEHQHGVGALAGVDRRSSSSASGRTPANSPWPWGRTVDGGAVELRRPATLSAGESRDVVGFGFERRTNGDVDDSDPPHASWPIHHAGAPAHVMCPTCAGLSAWLAPSSPGRGT